MYGKLRISPEMHIKGWSAMRASVRARSDLTPADVDAALSALDFFECELGFDWAQLASPLASTILIGGQEVLEAVRLARLALSLPPGPARSQLIDELGSPRWEVYAHAEMNLRIAGRFIRDEARVEILLHAHETTPDLAFYLGDRVIAVECTALGESAEATKCTEFLTKVIHWTWDWGAKLGRFEMSFDGPYTEEDGAQILAVLAGLTEESPASEWEFNEATARFSPGLTPLDSVFTDDRGPLIGSDDLKRALRKMNEKAKGQLSTVEGPTLLILQCHCLLANRSLSRVRFILDTLREYAERELPMMSAAVVYDDAFLAGPTEQVLASEDGEFAAAVRTSDGLWRTAVGFQNRTAKVSLTDEEFMRLARKVNW